MEVKMISWIMIQGGPWIMIQGGPWIMIQGGPWIMIQGGPWIMIQGGPIKLDLHNITMVFHSSKPKSAFRFGVVGCECDLLIPFAIIIIINTNPTEGASSQVAPTGISASQLTTN